MARLRRLKKMLLHCSHLSVHELTEKNIVRILSDGHQNCLEFMEVHHHPHVEKRSFKEYFLEFIMIFLAVTMGFFAESIRESISDSGKEKEYMVTMIEDLKKD